MFEKSRKLFKNAYTCSDWIQNESFTILEDKIFN